MTSNIYSVYEGGYGGYIWWLPLLWPVLKHQGRLGRFKDQCWRPSFLLTYTFNSTWLQPTYLGKEYQTSKETYHKNIIIMIRESDYKRKMFTYLQNIKYLLLLEFSFFREKNVPTRNLEQPRTISRSPEFQVSTWNSELFGTWKNFWPGLRTIRKKKSNSESKLG